MTPLVNDRLAAIAEMPIEKGAHPPDDGMCAMEMVAYLAGEAHSDAPQCASPVLTAFVVAWNDALPNDETRGRILRPFLSRLIDTRTSQQVEQRRADLAFDWIVRVHTPAWLDLRPDLQSHATALRALQPLLDRDAVRAAAAPLAAAQRAAAAARAAARDAAWDAARAAARDAAWDAAMDAARAAARDAAWDAAYTAARAVLTPTQHALEASAADLLDRMIRVTDNGTDAVEIPV